MKENNEKIKRDNQELYDANYNEDLKKEMLHAKELCYKFNVLEPSKLEEREKILRNLFGKVGSNVRIEPNFYCDYGYNISVGDNFYMNHNCVILDGGKVEFGDNVFIGPNCGFYTSGHPLDFKTRNKPLEYAKPIEIGDNVWIGGNVCVLPGVRIGSGSVIGAGSVVTKDIPENALAFGNPCKVKKFIK